MGLSEYAWLCISTATKKGGHVLSQGQRNREAHLIYMCTPKNNDSATSETEVHKTGCENDNVLGQGHTYIPAVYIPEKVWQQGQILGDNQIMLL
jgi:hypothetical protein